jgi:hypothetical protein
MILTVIKDNLSRIMENNRYRLELESLIPEEITSLNTRTWGFVIRNSSNIEEVAKEKYIDIVFPWHVTSVSVDFIEELLENIVMDYGEEYVLERFRLLSTRGYNFDSYLQQAIKQIAD